MPIYIKNLDNKVNTQLNIADCSLIVGSKQYIIKNDKAYERTCVDGEVHLIETDIIEVNDYQEKLFTALANTDGNSKLDKNDLTKLDPQKLQEELKQSAQQEKIYKIACKEPSKSSIEFGFDITDKNDANYSQSDILGIRFSNKTPKNENNDEITDVEQDSNLLKFAKTMGLTVAGGGLLWAFSKKKVRKTTGKLAKNTFNISKNIMKKLPKKMKLVGVLGLAGFAAYKLLSKDTTEKVPGLSVEHENLFNNFETEQKADKKEQNSKIGGAVLGAVAVGSTWAMVESKSVRNSVKQILGKIGNLTKKVPPKYRWIGGILTAGLTALGVAITSKDNEASIVVQKMQDEPIVKNKNKNKNKIKNKRYSVPTEIISKNDGEEYKNKTENPNLFNYIKKEYRPYITKISKNTGLSEYLIKNILATEQFAPIADDYGDGVITVGFGHTPNADHNKKFHKGYKISLEQAFEWFEQDILDAQGYARKSFTPKTGKYKGKFEYDEFPQSFKEALIDIAYNRGPGVMMSETIYKSLRENLSAGDNNMSAAAVRTRQERFSKPDMETGLRKRNIYRFLLAIRSLSGEQKLTAMRRFDRDERDANGQLIESYYTRTLKKLKNNDRRQVEEDWNNARRAAEYEAQQEEIAQQEQGSIKK